MCVANISFRKLKVLMLFSWLSSLKVTCSKLEFCNFIQHISLKLQCEAWQTVKFLAAKTEYLRSDLCSTGYKERTITYNCLLSFTCALWCTHTHTNKWNWKYFYVHLYLVLFKCFNKIIFHFHNIISAKSLYWNPIIHIIGNKEN